MNKIDKEQIQNFLGSIPDNFAVLEQGVPPSVQKEYIDLSKRIIRRFKTKTILERSQNLFDQQTGVQVKKKILIELAHLGTVESYRTIEKFLRQVDKELNVWAVLALRECRMFLESDLLEEKKGFISTGLGGKDNKIRYCFVIRSKDGMSFQKKQQEIIQDQFKRTCAKLDSVLENISFQNNFLSASILVSMDVAVGDVIEHGIENCNKEEPYLKFHYYVTNVSPPTEKDIKEYLEEIRD
jgi:hypothetical protein